MTDESLQETDQTLSANSKIERYAELVREASSLLEGERDFIASAANFAALVFHSLPDLNWAGFYLLKRNELVLGPFQGKPACVRIELGKGVCGTAAKLKETVIVDNVHEFPGHIACDSASNSEMVVPLMANGLLLGVFDLDSPLSGRFDEDDARGINEMLTVFSRCLQAELQQAG